MDFLVIRLGTKEIDTQEFLNKLFQVFGPKYKIELIEITSILPVEEVNWWTGLPEKTKLITLRDTKVYRNSSGTLVRNTLKKDDTSLEYWGRVVASGIKNYALVWKNPELWVDVEDVRPK